MKFNSEWDRLATIHPNGLEGPMRIVKVRVTNMGDP